MCSDQPADYLRFCPSAVSEDAMKIAIPGVQRDAARPDNVRVGLAHALAGQALGRLPAPAARVASPHSEDERHGRREGVRRNCEEVLQDLTADDVMYEHGRGSPRPMHVCHTQLNTPNDTWKYGFQSRRVVTAVTARALPSPLPICSTTGSTPSDTSR